MKKGEFSSITETTVTKLVLFLFSAALAFIVSRFADNIIKPGNTYGILNEFSADGFNPSQNFLKIFIIIAATFAFFYSLKYLLRYRKKLFYVLVVGIATFEVFSVVLMPGINGYTKNVDAFHHGEQLSPGNAFNHGKKPYSDIYILHGGGEDILVPAFAEKIAAPAHGISMYYFITTTLMVVSTALFFFLLSRLFKNVAVYLLVTAWFMFGVYSTFFYVRDIFIWLTVGLIFFLLLGTLTARKKIIASISLGVVASLSLFYAIDRGLIVCAMILVTITLMILTKQVKTGFVKFIKPSRLLKNYQNIALLIGSGVIIQLIGLVILGWKSYAAFISLSLFQIPKYQGMLFTYPLPDVSVPTILVWLPILVVVAVLAMYVAVLRTDWARKERIDIRSLFLFVILIGCALFIRSGYGRSDFGHIAYSTPLLFIALFYVMTLYFEKLKKNPERFIIPAAVILLLVFPVSTIDYNKVTSFMNVTPRIVVDYVKLPTYSDSHWLTKPLTDVTTYIKSRSHANDSLFVFTEQPIYYYLTNLENPTRFYIPWFADPTPLESELLNDLHNHPPTFIIYSSSTGWDTIDGFGMDKRTPTVNAWILANYHHSKVIDGVTILYK